MLRRLLLSSATLAIACGSPESGGPPPKTPRIACPDPIGSIPPESCAEIADDFGALSVAGALKLAGTGPEAEARISAIRAAGALGNLLKEKRVGVCEQYNACKLRPADLAARDKELFELMRALLDLWDKRRFSDAGGVARFHDELRALHRKLDGKSGDPDEAPAAGAAPAAATAREVPGEALARVDGPGLSFKAEAGVVTATAAGEGSREILRSRPDSLPLEKGHRYQITIAGAYAPPAAPLFGRGDEVRVKLRYRAGAAAEISVGLRSLEDVDWNEAASVKKVDKGEGSLEASLTASSNASGVYLVVGARGAAVDLDELEITRGDKLLAAARAEAPDEPLVKTRCAPSTKKPLAGTKSFHCEAPAPDLLTVGAPASYLTVAVRAGGSERASLSTVSLEGGRTIDAALPERGELVIGLAGPGTATVRSVGVREIAR